MKNRLLALIIICQIGLSGCAIPVHRESQITEGEPIRKAEVEAGLKEGTKREVVINEFGQPSWSAFDNRIICYEGELLQGVELNPIPVAAALAVSAAAVAALAYGSTGGIEAMGSYNIPEDYSENLYHYNRVLIYFNQEAELEKTHAYADIEGDRDHSRLIHLLEFSADVGIPNAWLTEENLQAVLGSGPVWRWGRGLSPLTTALYSAAENGQTDDIEVLLKTGLDVNAASDEGTTALLMASLRGHHETVEMLLNAGADVDAATPDGNTALILASRCGHTKAVQTLLKAGADVNAASKNGTTALLGAFHNDRGEVVRALLKAGADPTVIREES